MRPITFDKTEKIFNKFNGLKEDIVNKSDRLTESLPLFFRHMFIDGNKWYDQINRFDYLKKGYVTNGFGVLNKKFTNNICFCSEIFNESKKEKPISLDEFNKTVVITIDSSSVTVQDFILGIAYNGPIHRDPSKENGKLYELIYSEFLIKYLDISADLLLQISNFYVFVFQPFFEIFSGLILTNKHDFGFAPIIAKEGKPIDGLLFERGYTQLPVANSKRTGIRICMDIKFINFEEKENLILVYGHSKNKTFKVSVIQSINLLKCNILINGTVKTLKIRIESIDEYQKIEIAIYPDGYALVAKNLFVKDQIKVNSGISLIDGKVIFGANLSGTKFGIFQIQSFFVQAIDSKNNLTYINGFSFKKNLDIYGNENLPYNQINRPF